MSDPTVSPDMIEITVPATPTYGAMLRLVASAVGADAGWGIDDIDDLKLALAELLSIVGDQAGIRRLRATFRVHDDEVTVQLTVEPRVPLQRPDGLGATILGAVMDEVDWRPDGATLRRRQRDRIGSR